MPEGCLKSLARPGFSGWLTAPLPPRCAGHQIGYFEAGFHGVFLHETALHLDARSSPVEQLHVRKVEITLDELISALG